MRDLWMPGQSRTPLRVVTFNIAHARGLSLYQGFRSRTRLERNLRRIADLLLRIGADVVALQEIDTGSHWTAHLNMVDFLVEATGFEHARVGLNAVREGERPLAYGNAVLSRFPLAEAEHRRFGAARLGQKGFLATEVQLPKVHLPLLNVHLDFRSRRRRIEQVQQVGDFLDEQSQLRGTGATPALVCGDFNCGPSEEDAVQVLRRHLNGHGGYGFHPEGGRTFPSFMPARGLDFVLVPQRFGVRRVEVLPSLLSDHRPVMIELDVA